MFLDKQSFADLLVELKLISRDQLKEIFPEQTTLVDTSLETKLLESNLITELDLIKAKAIFYQMPWKDLRQIEVDPQAINSISEKLARRHLMLPLAVKANGLHIAIANPRNILALDEVQIFSGKTVVPHLALPAQILEAIEHFYRLDEQVTHKMIQQMEKEVTPRKTEEGSSIALDQAPIIRLVNQIIVQALNKRASDIHFEPSREMMRIRYRIDGVLAIISKFPLEIHPPLLSRLKIMANLDISQHFVPQDGSIVFVYSERVIDLRISIIPTIYGEKAVLRILNPNSQNLSLTELGYLSEDLELYRKMLKKSHGIILITGPTGSGKSTTLSSSVQIISSPSLNISTVEDPVEFKIKQVNQIQVNLKAGLTFAKALRSLLRQDPDVLMIGEIRDEETASIAFRAALTGHLVLSSLHTNDAISALTRLINLEIPKHLIIATLLGVVAQRLVRRICPDCSVEKNTELHRLEFLPEITLPQRSFVGLGCPKCNYSGYFGRIGIFEILQIDDRLRAQLNQQNVISQLDYRSLFQGKNLIQDACLKVERGLTTVSELLRVMI